MRLKALTLENFRGYKSRTTIPIKHDLTAIVGKNDAGKSSILEGLEIFFNNDVVKLERTDLSVDASSSSVRIGCIFDELPEEIIVDDSTATNLCAEYLVNQDGDLEIVKVFKVQEKISKEEIFLNAFHPSTEKFNNLLEKKIDDLKALGRELGAEVSDERKSCLWRAAIRAKATNLQLLSQLIPIGKFDAKAKSIWEKIESVLPAYALFKSDRKSSDEDAEAKDPMQAAVKLALNELQGEVDRIERQIKDKVLDVAQRTLAKLREMDSTLAGELMPKFKDKPKYTFSFSLDSDRGVPVNKRGSGVRRLILLNFFRAEADRRREESSRARVIYAIEEPETSLHPNMQTVLIKALLELSQTSDTQMLLTTHVPSLAGMIPTSSIIFVEMDGNKVIHISHGTDEVYEKAARSLGILPEKEIVGAKAIILVEGPTDITFLTHCAKALKSGHHTSHSFEDRKIVVALTGGCGNLKHWITKKTADDLGMPYAVFVDSDRKVPGEVTNNSSMVEGLKRSGVKAHCTRKREVENYLNPTAIDRIFSCRVAYGDYDDAKASISQATGLAKNEIIDRVWAQMTAAEILAMDQYSEDGRTKNELFDIINDFLSITS